MWYSLSGEIFMKKIYESEADKIIGKLTGIEGTDSKLLTSAIQRLRSKKDFDEDIKKLGRKLYDILLENGLNESEIINPLRLLDKIDGLLYQKQHDRAINLVEVLDSTEPCPQFDENGEKIYYLNNLFEAGILWKLHLNQIPEKIIWVPSPRNVYLKIKAEILFSLNKFKESEKVANEILKFNPVSFDANILLAKIYKRNNPEKFKKFLFNAYNVCYNIDDLKIFLKEMSSYYEIKKDFLSAYAIMQSITLFDSVSLVSRELERLAIEINKNRINKFTALKFDEVNRIMIREKIPFYIRDEIFQLICETYYDILLEENKSDKLVELCKSLVKNISKNSSQLVKDIEKLAKKAKSEKKQQKK